jgi:hypothetical protein
VAHQALDDNRALLQQLEQKSAVYVALPRFALSPALLHALALTEVRHRSYDCSLLELEAQVQVTEAQAGDSLDFRGSLSSLNHELALWCVTLDRPHTTGSNYSRL